MAQYIEKDALDTVLRELWKEDNGLSDAARDAYNGALQDIQCEIDALEIKEVNLDREIDRVWNENSDSIPPENWIEFRNISKHFFEFGLNHAENERKE